MSREQHRQLHVELHKSLDELVADWIEESNGFPSRSTVLELMQWSHHQTIKPADNQGRYNDPEPTQTLMEKHNL